MSARYKHVTDLNGEQMPMIVPHPDTAAYEAYAAGQYTAMANKRRDDALQAEDAERQAVERIRRAIEDQED